MAEFSDYINKKTSILLARNIPVALVVGAAEFLGSHLVDRLLNKGIQVVGVDDLEIGEKGNLKRATENKNFHLVIESAESCDFDLQRLDYIFIVSEQKRGLGNILGLFKKLRSRLLFVSSIDLYDKEKIDERLRWLKSAEASLAGFAGEHNLNARILRLGPVFGPRMHFRIKDPIIRLIQESLLGDLQKDISMEFSSRALYVDDAIDLMIKTLLSGATAQRIFDGVLPVPVKVSEIKQVLLDPVWYEAKDFSPGELPPWSTPNLLKTMNFLDWHPKTKLVAGLRKTLSYFKDNELVPSFGSESFLPKLEDLKVEDKKSRELKGLKPQKQTETQKKEVKKRITLPKFPFLIGKKIPLMLAIFIITYALIWPVLSLGWGVLTFHYQLSEAVKNLGKGDFEKGLENIKQAEFVVSEAEATVEGFEPIRKTGIFKGQFELENNFLNLANLSTASAKSTILGIQALFQSLKAVTGELNDSPSIHFTSAQVELASAGGNLSRAFALLESDDFNKSLPQVLKTKINILSERLTVFSSLVKKARVLSILLPSIVAADSKKDYLILLQNNMELRPTGGFIGSLAKVSFEGGKLKKLEANDVYAIDGQLGIHVEPPKEIKHDLGQNSWYLRDSNWEPDFPTSARQAEWFYTKETGERVEGIVSLDISAMQELLSVIGSLDLPDYSEKITPENLFEQAIAHAELSFFPGSQAKKSFLTALINQVSSKLFFLPNQNWPGIVTSLGSALEGKHMSIYLDDPKLFSYLVAQNWAHALPRASEQNSKADFLALVEANLGANKTNYYLDRSYNLETVVGKDGEIKHRLRITYLNRSPSDTFPGGKYKNRMRIYLPFGSKLERALWAQTDVTPGVSSFVDYGRSGYSLLLELAPREQKVLILDYSVPIKLEFKDNKAGYRLDIVKQAGTFKDPLDWTVTYPLTYQVVSKESQTIGPQELVVRTDLSKDRSFEIEFKK